MLSQRTVVGMLSCMSSQVGGEASTLKVGAGFVGEDVDLLAVFYGSADDAEGRTVAAGGEGSGVAVGEDGAFLREEFGSEAAEFLAVGDVFVVHLAGAGGDGFFDLGNGGVLGGEGVVKLADLADAPEEVNGGGAGGGEVVADDGDFGGERRQGGGGAAVYAEGDAHGPGDADGHGSADDHVADDGGDFFVVFGKDVGLFEGELGLVEEVNAGREPF